MKITRSKPAVTACTDANLETVSVTEKHTAIEFIQSAVSALSTWAVAHPDDAVATDSIANLGVVLLDLKSSM